MAESLKGLLRGNVITLDESVPPLDGKRVRVMIEPVEDDLSWEDNVRLWQHWADHGPQGPIEDDGEPEFP